MLLDIDQEIHKDDCYCLLEKIDELMRDFEELCERGLEQHGEFKDSDGGDDSFDTSNNESLIIEDSKPIYSRSKNTYKRRKVECKIIISSDLDSSLIEAQELEQEEADESKVTIDDNVNFSNDPKQNDCVKSITASFKEMLRYLWRGKIPKLSLQCAFTLGLDTVLYEQSIEPGSREIVNYYLLYMNFGESLGKLFKNESYLNFIIPSLIIYCENQNISIYKMILERYLEHGIEKYGFWEWLSSIQEKVNPSLSIDVLELLLPLIVHICPIKNDDDLEHIQALIDIYQETYTKECLVLLQKVIVSQIDKLNDPENLLSTYYGFHNLQKEHLIIISQLSTFIQISSNRQMDSQNTSFVLKLQNHCRDSHILSNISSLLYAFFTNDTSYQHHHGLTKQEDFIIPMIFKPEYKQTANFIKFTNKINYKTLLTIPKDISLLKTPSQTNSSKKIKRSKITSGDLI